MAIRVRRTMWAVAAGAAAGLAIVTSLHAQEACPPSTVFVFTNDQGAAQNQFWIDLDYDTGFNPYLSTANWVCDGVDNVLVDSRFNCAGPAVANGAKLRIAFRNINVPVQEEASGWGARDGDEDAILDGSEQAICSAVGGVAYPLETDVEHIEANGGRQLPLVVISVALAAGAFLMIARRLVKLRR